MLIANSQFLSLSMHFYCIIHIYHFMAIRVLLSVYLIRNFGGLSSVYSIIYIFLSYVCFGFCILCYRLYKYPVKHKTIKNVKFFFSLLTIESDSNELTADQETGF